MNKIISIMVCALMLAGCAKQELSPESLEAHEQLLQNTLEEDMSLIRAAEKTKNYIIVFNKGNELLEKEAKNDELRTIMARAYTKNNAPEMAVRVLNDVVDAENATVRIEKARAEVALGNYSVAHTILDTIEAQNYSPNDPIMYDTMKLRAVVFDLEGKHENAQDVYQRLMLVQNDIEVVHNYGMSLKASKKYAEAINTLLPIVEMSEYPQVRLAIATCYVDLGKKEDARNILEGFMTDRDINKVLGENS